MKTLYARALLPVLALCSVAALAQTPPTPAASRAMTGTNSMAGMSMTGDSDIDFATMMKAHHQKGLEMARKELDKGKSAEMKAVARKIVDAQTKEIAECEFL